MLVLHFSPCWGLILDHYSFHTPPATSPKLWILLHSNCWDCKLSDENRQLLALQQKAKIPPSLTKALVTMSQPCCYIKDSEWTFFLKFPNFLVPEQEIHRQIKALRDGGVKNYRACNASASHSPCTAQQVSPEETALHSHPRGDALCLVCAHHPLLPSLRCSSSGLSPSSQSCAEPPAAVLAQSGCSGPLLPQQPHRWGARSVPLPGWAQSWQLAPITLKKWIIFKWHLHTVQAWSLASTRELLPALALLQVRHLHWQSPPSTSCTGHGEHPSDPTDSSYTKHNLVKHFLCLSHLNLLTANFQKPYRPHQTG